MKRLVSMLGIIALLTSALMAAPKTMPNAIEDLTGKWAGSFVISMDGETKDDTAYMVLKQSGTELTGTAGPSSDQQWTIEKGKIDGNKVTFEVRADGPMLKFELTLADGHLKGEAKAEHEGRSMKAAVDVQRKKE
ncbi:MAG: hypothetical protein M3X11_00075 [Acidobacteriota bacterium]|nr:hypothetical protein [Acidobacteriota bacterium]